jgi:hypothetical protein
MALRDAGDRVCFTLQRVRSRLEGLDPSLAILLTDVFPFVDHPSMLGKPSVENESVVLAMRAQAKQILLLRPKVLLLGGENARYAVCGVIYEENFACEDLSLVLGMPACCVTIEGVKTVILCVPLPSQDGHGPQIIAAFDSRFNAISTILCPEKELSPVLQPPTIPAATPQQQKARTVRDMRRGQAHFTPVLTPKRPTEAILFTRPGAGLPRRHRTEKVPRQHQPTAPTTKFPAAAPAPGQAPRPPTSNQVPALRPTTKTVAPTHTPGPAPTEALAPGPVPFPTESPQVRLPQFLSQPQLL